MNKSEQQTLALASIFQTTALVHQLASTGRCDTHSNKASLNSIVSQGTSIKEIFRSPDDLKVGISSLKTVLAPKPMNMKNITYLTKNGLKKLEDELGDILDARLKGKRVQSALKQNKVSFSLKKYLKSTLLLICLLAFMILLLRLGPIGIRVLPVITVISLILYASRGLAKRFWKTIP